jgi:hypothetical protein
VVRLALPCLGLALAGCLNFRKVDDAKAPGDMLGLYHVDGTLDDSSCGDGALGSSEHWTFDVKLTRFDNDIYWLNGRETIVGDIETDGRTFSILSEVEVTVSAPGRGKPGCTVMRHDDAEGQLSASGTDVESFAGTLTYKYEVVDGFDCSDWIGTQGAVEALPCDLRYKLDGERAAQK